MNITCLQAFPTAKIMHEFSNVLFIIIGKK